MAMAEVFVDQKILPMDEYVAVKRAYEENDS